NADCTVRTHPTWSEQDVAVTNATPEGRPGFQVNLTSDQAVYCFIYNTPIPNPTLTIEKRVISDGGDTSDSVPASGWEFTPSGALTATAQGGSNETDEDGLLVFDLGEEGS